MWSRGGQGTPLDYGSRHPVHVKQEQLEEELPSPRLSELHHNNNNNKYGGQGSSLGDSNNNHPSTSNPESYNCGGSGISTPLLGSQGRSIPSSHNLLKRAKLSPMNWNHVPSVSQVLILFVSLGRCDDLGCGEVYLISKTVKGISILGLRWLWTPNNGCHAKAFIIIALTNYPTIHPPTRLITSVLLLLNVKIF